MQRNLSNFAHTFLIPLKSISRFCSYSALSDVRVLHTDIDLVTSSVAAPFDIIRMELDGKQIGKRLRCCERVFTKLFYEMNLKFKR